MITFKPIIIQGGRRKDGTTPVKIRVTFKGETRRLPTTLVCTDADLTRSGKIKNPTIIQKATVLIERMRATCDDLSPFALEEWDVDKVVNHIKEGMMAETFRLDFFTYADTFLESKSENTRKTYSMSLNTLERYLGERRLDINDISRKMLIDFVGWMEKEPAQHRSPKGEYSPTSRKKIPGGVSSLIIAKLAHIFNAAKWEYNDEDAGRILIPRSPFEGLKKAYPPSNGPRCLEVELVQRLIDSEPDDKMAALAKTTFLLSLCTMGANLADLYEATIPEGTIWIYNRKKTAPRRADKAEAKVFLYPETLALVASLRGQSEEDSEWWIPSIHRWRPTVVAVMINKGLRRWCEIEDVEPFSFGSARHTFATLSRRLGTEKATVDEALVHIGDYKITDIYAERNWSLSWEACRKVLDLFDWSKILEHRDPPEQR